MTQSIDLGAIANVPGATFRQRVNAGFQAAASQNYGPGAPPVVYPNMMWYDSASGRAKQRNTDNTLWLDLGPIGTQHITIAERAKIAKLVSVEDFGASGDGGTTDNSAAFSNAFAAVPNGGMIYVPPGVYSYTPPLNVPDGVTIEGHSSYASVLVARNGGTNCINLGLDCTLRHLHLTAESNRTSGAMVMITKNACAVEQFTMTRYYVGAAVLGTPSALVVGSRVTTGTMFSPSITPGGCAVSFNNFSSSYFQNTIISGPGTGTQPSQSVQIRHGDTIFLSGINATLHGTFSIQPIGAGEGTFSATITDCYFDSATGPAAQLIPTSGASIKNTVIKGTWFGLSGGHGCALNAAGGTIDGCEFHLCQFIGNYGGDGLVGIGPSLRNVAVIGGHAAANSGNGIHFLGASSFGIIGFRAGDVAERGSNGGSGIFVEGACNAYRIIACDLIPDGLNDSGSGTTKFVQFNLF